MLYLFAHDQIDLFKRYAHELRNALKPFAAKNDKLVLPKVCEILDILAQVLDYPDYQQFQRASLGHTKTLDYPLLLTPENFDPLSRALEARLGRGFTLGHCRWAIAGWFVLGPDRELDMEDVTLVREIFIRRFPYPMVTTAREERLVALGCLEREMEHPNRDPAYEAVFIGLRPTVFGRWMGARAQERLKGKLTHSDLAYFGLPNELCLYRLLSKSVTIRWGMAKPMNTRVTMPIGIERQSQRDAQT